VRSIVGISLLGSDSLNVANNLPDLLRGLAATDIRPNVFCPTWAIVGFRACATHGELETKNMFTYRGVNLY
jgi:hypothetical protein